MKNSSLCEMQLDSKPLRVVDFFCGGGGFSEGFRQAGFDIVFAVDKWAPAVNTYKGNKPGVNVRLDDVIRISNLPDEEFEKLVPDSEVIIGSPPCQAFSHSNKSGNADKTLGISLIEAYLRIIARKKNKKNSILKYWVLENVPDSQNYIKEQYSALDLRLEGDFVLKTRGPNAGIYNAKNFGAPTNRKRFICGFFPPLIKTHEDNEAVKLGDVLKSLGDPLSKNKIVYDINYPGLSINKRDITDFEYIHDLAHFEWQTCKRLKQDKGYMGRMAFPENLEKPARTIMATMTCSSREAMVFQYKSGRYRLPTVREAASLMSFPLDYWFYGKTKGIKHTLVGNAVPPKLSYAIAKAIANDNNKSIPSMYIPIEHDESISFVNLNGSKVQINQEKPRRDVAKFKYHIPYMIIDAFRVELTNYHSDFKNKRFRWDAEIRFSQGKKAAKVYTPELDDTWFSANELHKIKTKVDYGRKKYNISEYGFQEIYCMPKDARKEKNLYGPFELLDSIKRGISNMEINDEMIKTYVSYDSYIDIPKKILCGYYYLIKVIENMRGRGKDA